MTKILFFTLSTMYVILFLKQVYMQKHIQEDAKSSKKNTHRFQALESFQVFLIIDLKAERS